MQVDVAPRTRASVDNRKAIIESFRRILASRGVRGVIGLAQQLRIADLEKYGEIDANDFIHVIQNLKIPISSTDIRSLFELFSKDKKSKINYIEFMRAIKGEMDSNRRGLVEFAFKKLDKDNTGTVTIRDFLGAYCAQNHPLVRAGKRTGEQMLTEFIETFEMNKSLLGGSSDMIVTKEEFLDYYDSVSASVEDNKSFEDLIVSTWRLYNEEAKATDTSPKKPAVSVSQSAPFGTSEEPTDYSTALRPKKINYKEETKAAGRTASTRTERSTTKTSLRPIERQMVNLFKEKLLSKGMKGMLNLQKTFMAIDSDRSGYISFPEFLKVLKEFKFKYDETDAENLFKIFDKNRSGEISYNEFFHTATVINLLNVERDELIPQKHCFKCVCFT